jgi:hypothetical protein
MIARVAGETIAPPNPWMARKTISARPLLDSAQASDPSVKITMPTMKTRRRPKMSAARPPSSRNPPKASEYAVTIHWSVLREISRSCWIVGSATFTIATSRTTMKNATQTSASACQRRGSGTTTAASN